MEKYPYMKAFCSILIEHMGKGYSFETFGAEIRYPQYVVAEWVHSKEAFAEARSIGQVARKRTLESLLLSKVINLETFNQLNADAESDIEDSIGNFDDSVLIQAKERFSENK